MLVIDASIGIARLLRALWLPAAHALYERRQLDLCLGQAAPVTPHHGATGSSFGAVAGVVVPATVATTIADAAAAFTAIRVCDAGSGTVCVYDAVVQWLRGLSSSPLPPAHLSQPCFCTQRSLGGAIAPQRLGWQALTGVEAGT